MKQPSELAKRVATGIVGGAALLGILIYGGRWGAAVRHSEVVRWARSVFSTRIVHDELWPGKVASALG